MPAKDLLAVCRSEFRLAYGQPWASWIGAQLLGDRRHLTVRKEAKALFDELRRWTGKAEALIEDADVADEDAIEALLPDLRVVLDALARRQIAPDLDPVWRDRYRSDRGRLAGRIVQELKALAPTARNLAIVSLLVGNRPEGITASTPAANVIIRETDAMRKAALRAGIVLATPRRGVKAISF